MGLVSAGRIVGAKYELVRFLGRGSMGEVWVARHRGLGEEVAIKLLLPASSGDAPEDPATSAARFRFEARVAARLSRKTRHIVRVTDHGEEGGLPYLVMELLEGQALDKRLLSRGTLPPAEVASIVAQIARALREAHADGVIHRDLKPANIFLAKDEDGSLLVKLLDFGIARATQTLHTTPMRVTAHGIVFGTPGYMSPEQAFAPKVDYRCDLWALATVAYEALSGDLPVPGLRCEELLANLHDRRIVPVHARNAALPQGLAPFFERAFAAGVERRFADVSELARAFERAIEPSPTREVSLASPVPTLRLRTAPMASRPPRRPVASSGPGKTRSRLAVVGPVVAIAALLVAAVAWRAPTNSLAASRSRSPSIHEPPEPPVVSYGVPSWAPSPDDSSTGPALLPGMPDASAPLRSAPSRVVAKAHSPPAEAPPVTARPTPPARPSTPPASVVPTSPAATDRSAVF
jgi:serine/threonine protein kinase